MRTTITYREIEIEIEYDFTPGVMPVFYYPDGSGDPGSPPEVEIEDVFHNGESIFLIIESQLEALEDILLEKHTDEAYF